MSVSEDFNNSTELFLVRKNKMRIEAINNGWLVYVGQDQYLGSNTTFTQFCGTKEEVLTTINNNLKSREEIQAEFERVRREEMEQRKAYQNELKAYQNELASGALIAGRY